MTFLLVVLPLLLLAFVSATVLAFKMPYREGMAIQWFIGFPVLWALVFIVVIIWMS